VTFQKRFDPVRVYRHLKMFAWNKSSAEKRAKKGLVESAAKVPSRQQITQSATQVCLKALSSLVKHVDLYVL